MPPDRLTRSNRPPEPRLRVLADGRRIGLAFVGSEEEIVTSGIHVAGGVVYVGTNARLLALRCAD